MQNALEETPGFAHDEMSSWLVPAGHPVLVELLKYQRDNPTNRTRIPVQFLTDLFGGETPDLKIPFVKSEAPESESTSGSPHEVLTVLMQPGSRGVGDRHTRRINRSRQNFVDNTFIPIQSRVNQALATPVASLTDPRLRNDLGSLRTAVADVIGNLAAIASLPESDRDADFADRALNALETRLVALRDRADRVLSQQSPFDDLRQQAKSVAGEHAAVATELASAGLSADLADLNQRWNAVLNDPLLSVALTPGAVTGDLPVLPLPLAQQMAAANALLDAARIAIRRGQLSLRGLRWGWAWITRNNPELQWRYTRTDQALGSITGAEQLRQRIAAAWQRYNGQYNAMATVLDGTDGTPPADVLAAIQNMWQSLNQSLRGASAQVGPRIQLSIDLRDLDGQRLTMPTRGAALQAAVGELLAAARKDDSPKILAELLRRVAMYSNALSVVDAVLRREMPDLALDVEQLDDDRAAELGALVEDFLTLDRAADRAVEAARQALDRYNQGTLVDPDPHDRLAEQVQAAQAVRKLFQEGGAFLEFSTLIKNELTGLPELPGGFNLRRGIRDVQEQIERTLRGLMPNWLRAHQLTDPAAVAAVLDQINHFGDQVQSLGINLFQGNLDIGRHLLNEAIIQLADVQALSAHSGSTTAQINMLVPGARAQLVRQVQTQQSKLDTAWTNLRRSVPASLDVNSIFVRAETDRLLALYEAVIDEQFSLDALYQELAGERTIRHKVTELMKDVRDWRRNWSESPAVHESPQQRYLHVMSTSATILSQPDPPDGLAPAQTALLSAVTRVNRFYRLAQQTHFGRPRPGQSEGLPSSIDPERLSRLRGKLTEDLKLAGINTDAPTSYVIDNWRPGGLPTDQRSIALLDLVSDSMLSNAPPSNDAHAPSDDGSSDDAMSDDAMSDDAMSDAATSDAAHKDVSDLHLAHDTLRNLLVAYELLNNALDDLEGLVSGQPDTTVDTGAVAPPRVIMPLPAVAPATVSAPARPDADAGGSAQPAGTHPSLHRRG